MIYKNFRFGIVIRVLVIVALALALAFVVMRMPAFFVPLVIAIALAVAIASLIRYIEKSNKNLTHFLLSIRQGAFTESYGSGGRGKPHEALSDALNDVVREFARLNLEKELHYQYLQALNENIGVCILTFDDAGQLVSMNSAAKQLLRNPSISHLDHFQRVDAGLHKTLSTARPDERKVITVLLHNEYVQLGILVQEIILQGKRMRIFLLQNLSQELEAKEIEAWNQLMRVLTHEIMNSVTPIVSLTEAMQSILNHPDGTKKNTQLLSDENMDDIYSSLHTIRSRSQGLLRFVNAFKEYSKPLELRQQDINVLDTVNNIGRLLGPALQQAGIRLDIREPARVITAKADEPMLEQVLINIIKNAMEALPADGSGVITVTFDTINNNKVRITIADNGGGMDDETMGRIFIPFYSTKAKGTGIGLSLSRQIMKSHGGNIRVQSSPGKGAAFFIEWPG